MASTSTASWTSARVRPGEHRRKQSAVNPVYPQKQWFPTCDTLTPVVGVGGEEEYETRHLEVGEKKLDNDGKTDN